MIADRYVWRACGSGLCSALVCLSTLAAEPTGRGILERQKQVHDVPRETSHLTMRIYDRKGRARERALVTRVKRDKQGDARVLLKFLSPADIREVGLLTWEHGAGRKDDQWLYLPAARAVKRIAGATRKGAFMGTDLAYEDLQAEDLSRHSYTLLGSEAVDGVDCWKVEAQPGDKAERSLTGYGRRVLWVRKQDWVTARIDFFNHARKHVKTATFGDVVALSGALRRANRVVYEQPLRKTRTELIVTARDLESPISDALLTRQGLMRPSR